MARYYVAGVNDEALTAPATDVRELISGLDPDGDGRIFYAKTIMLNNEHATAVGFAEFYDSDESTAVTASTQRGGAQVPATETVILEFPDNAYKFVTNLTAGVTNGTFSTLTQHASGYLN